MGAPPKKIDPRMHSAEHILNQTMDRMFGCGRCIAAHIERKKSKCDYRLERALGESEVHTIEARVNAIIRADLPIFARNLSYSQAQAQYDLTRLPPGTSSSVRIVHIGDFDACPCIGPHVPSTAAIGNFRITTVSHTDGVLRIRFKCR